MTAKYRMQDFRCLRIFCPISEGTLKAMLAGDAAALEQDITLTRMLDIIRADSPLGDFGIYKSVVGIVPGWELFAAADNAKPTLGEPGTRTASPTAILTIYVANERPKEAVERAFEALVEAHPWEVPVIELSETSLLMR